jgi:hypothetical protein
MRLLGTVDLSQLRYLVQVNTNHLFTFRTNMTGTVKMITSTFIRLIDCMEKNFGSTCPAIHIPDLLIGARIEANHSCFQMPISLFMQKDSFGTLQSTNMDLRSFSLAHVFSPSGIEEIAHYQNEHHSLTHFVIYHSTKENRRTMLCQISVPGLISTEKSSDVSEVLAGPVLCTGSVSCTLVQRSLRF